MHGVQRCSLLLPMFRGLCICVCVCDCLLDITMSCAKIAEPIEMSLGVSTGMGQRTVY